jgi:hypothetical protein
MSVSELSRYLADLPDEYKDYQVVTAGIYSMGCEINEKDIFIDAVGKVIVLGD